MQDGLTVGRADRHLMPGPKLLKSAFAARNRSTSPDHRKATGPTANDPRADRPRAEGVMLPLLRRADDTRGQVR